LADEPKTEPLGSASVGLAEIDVTKVGRPRRLRERDELKGWGACSPKCMKGGWFDTRTENRAPWARHRWDLRKLT
jgi:hypothetical protein